MTTPLIQRLNNAIADPGILRVLSAALGAVFDRLSSQITVSGTLAITGAASTTAKTSNVVTALVNGQHVSIAGQNMPALTGLVITANRFNVACFYVDVSGVVTVRFGTEGATAGAVKFPEPPQKAAMIGYALITHSATFTGGTTALDTATTVYVNTVGPCDPTAIL
jgi:hypothetical protein